MAITFDNTQVIDKIYLFDSSAGTYTERSPSATADLFTNDVGVGDCLYFGKSQAPWHDLQINVSTTLVADAITIVWEYYAYDSTWKTLTVTDGTNNFTTSGANWVTFSAPDGWARIRLNNLWYGMWIRARVTAVTNPTEGGAKTGNINNLDFAIQVTETVRLSDILSADTAGGWGQVVSLGNHYQILCNLKIGNGTTTTNFTIRNCEYLEVGYQASPWSSSNVSTSKFRTIFLNTNAIFNIGVLSEPDTSEGSLVKWWNLDVGNGNVWGGNLNIYNSHFIKSSGGYNNPMIGSVCDIRNSVLTVIDGSTWYFRLEATGNLKNVTFSIGTYTYVYLYSKNLGISNLILGRSKGVLAGVGGGVVQDTDFGTTKSIQAGNTGITCSAKNCTFSDYATQITMANNCTVNVLYTVNFSVTDENGTAITTPMVRIVNSQGTVLFNNYWTQALDVTAFVATSPAGVRTNTDYCPLEIWISKDGYETSYQKLTLNNTNKNIYVKLRQGTPGRDSMGQEFK